jgi:hypothetical protein
MMLYTNGDSHTAAAEAMNPHGFAADDSRYFYLGQAPHPDNLAVSWSKRLSEPLKMGMHCHAQAGCSNTRILRTTREFLTKLEHLKHNWFMIIQWSTWEREEWLYQDSYYQVGASGIDSVPPELQDRYREFVTSVDWEQKTQYWHNEIWQLHQELDCHKIPHIFFNGDQDFDIIPDNLRHNWGTSYIGPYDPSQTYAGYLKSKNIQTVAPDSWHYGPDGHSAWARFLMQYIITNKLV